MRTHKLFRTDMAWEIAQEKLRAYGSSHAGMPDGVRNEEFEQFGFSTQRVRLCTPQAAELFGKDMGCYTTLFVGDVTDLSRQQDALQALCAEISHCIRLAAAQEHVALPRRILLAGLGNRDMACDAIGPLTAGEITVTGAPGEDRGVWCLAPGVTSQTGMETAELIRAAAKLCRTEMIVLADALAARTAQWLCKTVQISSCGIRPGSGAGHHRQAVTAQSMGVPVVTLGVPMLIDAATLLLNALPETAQPPEETLQSYAKMPVTVNHVDTAAFAWGRLLAGALDCAFASLLSQDCPA